MYKSENTNLIKEEDYDNDMENNNGMMRRTDFSLEGLTTE